jgi:ATP-dependent helicase/nuclease subunit A
LLVDLKDRADDEYRRLLYVGMTRAEDRLIICGYHGVRAQGPRTWHSIVARPVDRG